MLSRSLFLECETYVYDSKRHFRQHLFRSIGVAEHSKSTMLKLSLILYVALVGTTFADAHHEDHDELCSGGDGNIVIGDWNRLWENSDSSFKVAFAKEVLLEVVKQHPEAKELFHGVNIDNPNSGEFEAHSLRIINTFDLLVNLLQDRHALHEASAHLGHQHAARPGVLGKYFKTFGNELIRALAHLIDDFHFIAWKGCFKTLTKEIVGSVPE